MCVADGSIAYSAVTQPRPEPDRHRGTPSVTLAAHSTRVFPNSINTDPAGHCWKPRVIRMSRSASSFLPSVLSTALPYCAEPGDSPPA
ncbi:hypothetical protein GCM10018963_14160 [Saccharothrix longispora]